MKKFFFKNRYPLFLLLIVLAHLISASYFLLNKSSGDNSALHTFPLDDAYVHLVYARNFARYGKFWYNYNDSQTGATSPLYVIILSFFFKLGFEKYIIYIVKMLGIFFAIGVSFIIFYLVTDLTKNYYFGLFGGILIALHPQINNVKVSGMESMLFTFLILISIISFVHNKLLFRSQEYCVV